MTPIMHAALEKRVDEVEWLLKAGADITALDDRGQNVVHHAVIGGSTSVTKTEWDGRKKTVIKDNPEHAEVVLNRLLQAGADPNVRDKDGWTPLIWATKARANHLAAILEKSTG